MSTATPKVTAASPAAFSLEHYEHMVACGAFDGEYQKRIELLWGRIVDMPPIGPSHSDDIDFLTVWSVQSTLDKPIRIRIQNPIRLPDSDSEPEPDVCWVRQADYSRQHPNPEDVLLVIEVAESSLAVDRGPKLAAYARARIPDYWIVNLVDKQLEVFRQPSGDDYREKAILRETELASPLALPELRLPVKDLF